MADFIELTPKQAEALLYARTAELNSIRHTEENWERQVERDIVQRNRYVADAFELGVPPAQIKRFILHEK